MTEFDRFIDGIAWIDLSFVERDRTQLLAIEVGIRCHLAGMSLREVSKLKDDPRSRPEVLSVRHG